MLSENELRGLYGKEYVEAFEKKQSILRLHRLIQSIELKTTYVVADFACGNGMLLPLISNRIAEYIGVDFSEEFIKAAEKKKKALAISNAKFVCTNILDFCAKNAGIYDVAFAMDFSEHVYDEEWINILCAINRSLKRGGKLYIHTPNADFFWERMKSKNFIFRQLPGHIAVRSPKDNCKLLMKSGFIIHRIKLISHYNILRFLHPLSFIPIIGKFFKARIFIEAVAQNNPDSPTNRAPSRTFSSY